MTALSPHYGMVVHNAVELWMLVAPVDPQACGDSRLVWDAVALGTEAGTYETPQMDREIRVAMQALLIRMRRDGLMEVLG